VVDELRDGDLVTYTGTTGRKYLGVLVGKTKTKARIRLWKASKKMFGSIQDADLQTLTKADTQEIP
jgi:hypothetical protein